MKKRGTMKGFTMVEVMIVVAIIGLLAAIAFPSFIKVRSVSRMNACKNNMRTIEYATEQAALELGTATGATPAEETVNNYIKGGVPVCPVGGTYTYPAVSGNASCSQHGTIASPNEV